MRNYLDLIQYVLDNGDHQINERTGELCIGVTGTTLKFDLREGFPAVTTKKLAWNSLIGELVGFLQAKTNAADFRGYRSPVWDQNANANQAWLANPFRKSEDDLGPVYGYQWRNWPAFKMQDDRISLHGDALIRQAKIDDQLMKQGWRVVASDHTDEHNVWFKAIDQVKEVLTKIVKTPSDRRILFHAWNPAMIDEMALPPCHLLYQFIPKITGDANGVLHRDLDLVLGVRSWDVALGAPFNISEAAAMLSLFAQLTGFTPRFLTIQGGDVHIYEKHLDMVHEQLKREPFAAPSLLIDSAVPAATLVEVNYAPDGVIERAMAAIDNLKPEHLTLHGYQSHEKLTAPMAV